MTTIDPYKLPVPIRRHYEHSSIAVLKAWFEKRGRVVVKTAAGEEVWVLSIVLRKFMWTNITKRYELPDEKHCPQCGESLAQGRFKNEGKPSACGETQHGRLRP